MTDENYVFYFGDSDNDPQLLFSHDDTWEKEMIHLTEPNATYKSENLTIIDETDGYLKYMAEDTHAHPEKTGIQIICPEESNATRDSENSIATNPVEEIVPAGVHVCAPGAVTARTPKNKPVSGLPAANPPPLSMVRMFAFNKTQKRMFMAKLRLAIEASCGRK